MPYEVIIELDEALSDVEAAVVDAPAIEALVARVLTDEEIDALAARDVVWEERPPVDLG